MHKKTIAIVINTSWNIFNFRLGLLKTLEKDGYKIVAIAPKDAYSKKLEDLGFEYHEIKMNNKGTNPIEDAKLIFDFYKLYKKIQPDILLQYTIKPNIYGSLAAGVLGIPVVSNISGLGTVFLNDSLSSRIARLLYKIALKVPQKVFYQNAHDRELFVQSYLVKEEKTDLLPGSGIDTERFKPINQDKRDEKVKFLFIARLLKDKGLVEYVDAAQMLSAKCSVLHPSCSLEAGVSAFSARSVRKEQEFPDQVENDVEAEFHILGDFYPGNPTAIREEEMQVWEEEGSVKYIGTSDDVRSVIAEYDCVVLPSYREGLSRVLLEAASMGKPIITTNVPGCREVVNDGVNGFLCEVKDVDSLKNQMEKMMLLSDEKRSEMGRRGREKIIHEFDEKIVITKYKKAIEGMLDSAD